MSNDYWQRELIHWIVKLLLYVTAQKFSIDDSSYLFAVSNDTGCDGFDSNANGHS